MPQKEIFDMPKMVHRSKTRPVRVGDLVIGGSNEVIIQSMTTTKTHDVEATVAEILRLEEAGCQIVRVACPEERDALALAEIKSRINIPLVVDIHFNYKLALMAIEAGVDKIRINPGNIGRREKVEAVVTAAKAKNIPIRIGVNAGSLEKHILEKYGYPTARGMVESALHHIKILEDLDFHDIIVSLKASDVQLALEAYQLASESFDYPLHVGITESGPLRTGSLKSAAGLGAILSRGIGNTVRVSLSADPVEEVKVAKEVLKSFGLAANAATLISCPTCGRIEIDLMAIAAEIEDYIDKIQVNIKVAVLGCAVNGPGEAREADIGIAGARNEGLLFRHGEIIRKVPEATMVEELKKEIDAIVLEKEAEKEAAKASQA
jgi:(E)-4-hydroxy-3-methylbut-2-enyl-diphosphate synthase